MTAELHAYARDAAIRAGIDPERFVRQIETESGFNPKAHNDGSGADGIAQIVVRWHPSMDGKTRDPYISLDYAAGLMQSHLAARSGDWALALSNYNAGPTATSRGLAGTLPGWPYAETVRYVSIILQISQDEARGRLTGAAPMPIVVYTPDTPLILQNDEWSCWPTSARMALEAWGRKPTEGWIESQAIKDGIVSMDLGLLDGSGAAGAAWLTRQYSDPAEGTPTIKAQNAASVSFDDVRSVAGKTAVLLGGHGWGAAGHWVFVRTYEASLDLFRLGNPAGDGPTYGGRTLSRQQFDARGPFSMMVVTADGAAVASPPPPPPPASELEALRAENERLRTVIGYASTDISAAIDKETAQIRASLGALDAATNTLREQS